MSEDNKDESDLLNICVLKHFVSEVQTQRGRSESEQKQQASVSEAEKY